MRISDWSSDVCSSDLEVPAPGPDRRPAGDGVARPDDRARLRDPAAPRPGAAAAGRAAGPGDRDRVHEPDPAGPEGRPDRGRGAESGSASLREGVCQYV